MAVKVGDIINFSGIDSEFNIYPNMDSRYGPYSSIEQALESLDVSQRSIGLTIGVKSLNEIKEYWFKDGIQNENLKEKSETLYSKYISSGGLKSKEEFYKYIKEIVDTSAFIILHSNVDNIQATITFKNNNSTKIGVSNVTS